MPDFYFILFLKRLDADEKLQYFQLPYIPCRMVYVADHHQTQGSSPTLCHR
jgi:hypothetical protein